MEASTRLPFGATIVDPPLRVQADERQAVDTDLAHKIEVGVPMRDGIELAADVYLPAKEHRPAPAIVTGTPYNKDSFAGPPIERQVEAGYAVVFFDSRGRGKSEGDWHPFTMADAYDGHDAVEWVAEQPWCTSKVGVTGLSYNGWTTMATVSQSPEHLAAAVPFSPAGRWQEEIPYTHGCLQIFFAWWWAYVRRRINDDLAGVPELLQILPVEAMGEVLNAAGPGWQEMMERDTLDEVWKSRRWDGAYDFDVPCLHVTGWHDREDIHGAFHHYEEMIARSPAPQWLLVGPWPHVSTISPSREYKGVEYEGAALDMDAIALRFFDRFLKDEDNGVDHEPRVQIYDPGAGRWEMREQWAGGTVEREFLLGAGGGMSDTAGEDGEDVFRYDATRPNGLQYDLDVLPLEPPLDLGELEAQDGVLTWTSKPLPEDLRVRGWGELELFAATDGDDTEWHVKVSDVDDADGSSLWVAWGCLRASHGDDPSAPAPVTPGQTKRYAIEITPAFHTFRAGHRIRVVLASSEFPWFARNLGRFGPIGPQSETRVVTNTIARGTACPSRLRLQVEQ